MANNKNALLFKIPDAPDPKSNTPGYEHSLMTAVITMLNTITSSETTTDEEQLNFLDVATRRAELREFARLAHHHRKNPEAAQFFTIYPALRHFVISHFVIQHYMAKGGDYLPGTLAPLSEAVVLTETGNRRCGYRYADVERIYEEAAANLPEYPPAYNDDKASGYDAVRARDMGAAFTDACRNMTFSPNTEHLMDITVAATRHELTPAHFERLVSELTDGMVEPTVKVAEAPLEEQECAWHDTVESLYHQLQIGNNPTAATIEEMYAALVAYFQQHPIHFFAAGTSHRGAISRTYVDPGVAERLERARPPVSVLRAAVVERDPTARETMARWLKSTSYALHFLPPELAFPPYVVHDSFVNVAKRANLPSTQHAALKYGIGIMMRYMRLFQCIPYTDEMLVDMPPHLSVLMHAAGRYAMEELVWRIDQNLTMSCLTQVQSLLVDISTESMVRYEEYHAASWTQKDVDADTMQRMGVLSMAKQGKKMSQAVAENVHENMEKMAAKYLADFDVFLLRVLECASRFPYPCETTQNLRSSASMAMGGTQPEMHLQIVRGFYRAIKTVANQFVSYCSISARRKNADDVLAAAELAALEEAQREAPEGVVIDPATVEVDVARVMVTKELSYKQTMDVIEKDEVLLPSVTRMVAIVESRLPPDLSGLDLKIKVEQIEATVAQIVKTATAQNRGLNKDEASYLESRQQLLSLLKNTMLACTKAYHLNCCPEVRMADRLFALVDTDSLALKDVQNNLMSKMDEMGTIFTGSTGDSAIQKMQTPGTQFKVLRMLQYGLKTLTNTAGEVQQKSSDPQQRVLEEKLGLLHDTMAMLCDTSRNMLYLSDDEDAMVPAQPRYMQDDDLD